MGNRAVTFATPELVTTSEFGRPPTNWVLFWVLGRMGHARLLTLLSPSAAAAADTSQRPFLAAAGSGEDVSPGLGEDCEEREAS